MDIVEGVHDIKGMEVNGLLNEEHYFLKIKTHYPCCKTSETKCR